MRIEWFQWNDRMRPVHEERDGYEYSYYIWERLKKVYYIGDDKRLWNTLHKSLLGASKVATT